MNPALYRNSKSNLFDMFFDDQSTRLHHRVSGRNNMATCSAPATNIFETKEDYKLEIAAPGLNKKDFEIEITDSTIKVSSTVENSKKDEGVTYRKKEFTKSSFTRNFRIPEDVDPEKIEANYTQGVLMISLPKSKKVKIEKAKQIKVG